MHFMSSKAIASGPLLHTTPVSCGHSTRNASQLKRSQHSLRGKQLVLGRPGRWRRQGVQGRRGAAVAPRAMVNVDYSPALLLGMALMASGVGLSAIRRYKPQIASEWDLVISAIVLVSGGILVFQGWRLDPLLLFCQLLTTGTAFWYGVEAVRNREIVRELQGLSRSDQVLTRRAAQMEDTIYPPGDPRGEDPRPLDVPLIGSSRFIDPASLGRGLRVERPRQWQPGARSAPASSAQSPQGEDDFYLPPQEAGNVYQPQATSSRRQQQQPSSSPSTADSYYPTSDNATTRAEPANSTYYELDEDLSRGNGQSTLGEGGLYSAGDRGAGERGQREGRGGRRERWQQSRTQVAVKKAVWTDRGSGSEADGWE